MLAADGSRLTVLIVVLFVISAQAGAFLIQGFEMAFLLFYYYNIYQLGIRTLLRLLDCLVALDTLLFNFFLFPLQTYCISALL